MTATTPKRRRFKARPIADLAADGAAHRARLRAKHTARAKLAAFVERLPLDCASRAALLSGLAAEYEERAHEERKAGKR